MAVPGFSRRGPQIEDSFHFGMDHMIELPANFILLVCVGIVAATGAFIVYGMHPRFPQCPGGRRERGVQGPQVHLGMTASLGEPGVGPISAGEGRLAHERQDPYFYR